MEQSNLIFENHIKGNWIVTFSGSRFIGKRHRSEGLKVEQLYQEIKKGGDYMGLKEEHDYRRR